jgi:hypothetical protein
MDAHVLRAPFPVIARLRPGLAGWPTVLGQQRRRIEAIRRVERIEGLEGIERLQRVEGFEVVWLS